MTPTDVDSGFIGLWAAYALQQMCERWSCQDRTLHITTSRSLCYFTALEHLLTLYVCGSDFTQLNLIGGHFEPFSWKFHISHLDEKNLVSACRDLYSMLEGIGLLTLLSSAKRYIEKYSIVFGTFLSTTKIGVPPKCFPVRN